MDSRDTFGPDRGGDALLQEASVTAASHDERLWFPPDEDSPQQRDD